MKMVERDKSVYGLRWLHLLALVSVAWAQAVIPVAAESVAFALGPGHSAHWYSPDRSGEGVVLEILPGDRAQMYWFTYDEHGQQRWLLGTGDIVTSGDEVTAVFTELLVTHGGRFGPGFDPGDVVMAVVGQAEIGFVGCDEAVFSYHAFGQEETLSLSRLSRTMGVDCAGPIHGRTMFPVTDDGSLSGSWYDPEYSGQGFALQWLDRDEAILTWYTYDGEGQQRWFIGDGRRDGDQIVFDNLMTSQDGQFGPDFDPEAVELLPWGSLTMNLACDEGEMSWTSPLPGFGEGSMELSRLTRLSGLDCEHQKPGLLELYDVELLTTIPVDSPGYPIANRPDAMTDDGSVVGLYPTSGRYRAWNWTPGDEELQNLSEDDTGSGRLFMAPDGSFIVMTLDRGVSDGYGVASWTKQSGWRPVEGFHTDRASVYAMSQDGRHLAGMARNPEEAGNPFLWVWNASEGQKVLSSHLESGFAFGVRGVSNDGRTIVGFGTDFPVSNDRRDRAVRWINGEADFLQDASGNSLLVAFGCSLNCQIIFGGGQSNDMDPAGPAFRRPWIWTEEFGVEYLERLPEATERFSYDALLGASADGNLIFGDTPFELPTMVYPDLQLGTRGFVWTRATGVQALAEVLEQVGIDDSDWRHTGLVDVSSDGLLWLVSMRRSGESGLAEGNAWAGLIQLTPRVQPYE